MLKTGANGERPGAGIWAGLLTGGRALCAALALTPWTGCSLDLASPEVLEIRPDWGYNGEPTQVQVVGRDFLPEVSVDTQQGVVSAVAAYQGYLVDAAGEQVALGGLRVLDQRTLSGVIRSGLPVGRYDLLLVAPDGETSRLDDGFRVSDTRADRLGLEADQVVFTAGEVGYATLTLLDPEGRQVLGDLEVAVEARGQDGSLVGAFTPGALAGQVDEAGRVTGRLGPTGEVLVGLRVDLPEVVTLTASPLATDSSIAEARLVMAWEPGDDLQLQLERRDPDQAVVAGQPFWLVARFLDGAGNLVPDRADSVTLLNDCGGFALTFDLVGQAEVEVLLTVASANRCLGDTDRITSLGWDGATDRFVVSPGPVAGFGVVVSPSEVRAGESVSVQVEARDAWLNPTPYTEGITLTDDLDGLIEVSTVLPLPGGGVFRAVPTLAGEPRLRAAGVGPTGEVVGYSDPVRVLPSAVVARLDLEVVGPWVAGAPGAVLVRSYDAFGNLLPADDPLARPLEVGFDNEVGSPEVGISCDYSQARADGAGEYLCIQTVSRDRARVRASLPTGIEATSAPFSVINGELASVTLTPTRLAVTAGQALPVALSGYDAWGNVYLVQSDPEVSIRDELGGLSPIAISLGPDGSTEALVTLTRAGLTSLVVSQDGVDLGRSAEVLVSAGDAVELRVQPLVPWSWVGEPSPIRVEAVDLYGNRADVDADGVLRSTTTPLLPVAFSLVNGVAATNLVWPTSSLTEVLEAESGDLAGDSATHLVVARCGATGPQLVASFGGFPEPVVCRDPFTGLGTVAASFALSLSGGSPITTYAVAAHDLGLLSVSSSTTTVLRIGEVGIFPLDLLVAQVNGCGSEGSVRAYVGVDDGSLVGPIRLAPDLSSLPVGSPSGVLVRVGPATDCTRDPAAGAEVRLRSTKGTLSGLRLTGSGLALTLDGSGSGSFTFRDSGLRMGGPADLIAWVPEGTAEGFGTIELLGDEVPPQVWGQTPWGETAEDVAQVELLFNEPLLPSSVLPDRFTLSGTASAVSAVTLSPDGQTVEVSLDPPVQGMSEAAQLVVSSRLRDLAGNLLDGAFVGSGGTPYDGFFGSYPPTVDPASCVVRGGIFAFRPDGDPGAGEEADQVFLELSSDSAPAFWLMDVRNDPEGSLLLRRWVEGRGAFDTLSWDGRDASGRVQPNGTYTVEVQPLDAFGNRAEGCTVVVTLDNFGASE